MEAILNSVMFREAIWLFEPNKNISKHKLVNLYDKYKETKISIKNTRPGSKTQFSNRSEDITDKDELIFCYYLMKYQQNIEINTIGSILTNLSIN